MTCCFWKYLRVSLLFETRLISLQLLSRETVEVQFHLAIHWISSWMDEDTVGLATNEKEMQLIKKCIITMSNNTLRSANDTSKMQYLALRLTTNPLSKNKYCVQPRSQQQWQGSLPDYQYPWVQTPHTTAVYGRGQISHFLWIQS